MEADREEVDKILCLSLNLSKRGYLGNSASFFILKISPSPPFAKGRTERIRKGANLLSKLKVFVYDRGKNSNDTFSTREGEQVCLKEIATLMPGRSMPCWRSAKPLPPVSTLKTFFV
jgi:hypothetical protein